jgi:long-chain acyl-CoA synthetase
MTENGGTCTRVLPRDPASAGTVGPPQASIEIKLVDVPAMGYTSEDKPNPRGEICCRGPCVFSTYYKGMPPTRCLSRRALVADHSTPDTENTAKTVDADGWVHTGDVGEFDSAGRLKIVDRVKNIMKLSQGEYVALEKIENLYSAHPLVAQLYVHGDSLQPFLIAVVIPDPAQLAALASRVHHKRIAATDGAALVQAAQDPLVAQEIMKVLNKEAAHNQLKGCVPPLLPAQSILMSAW